MLSHGSQGGRFQVMFIFLIKSIDGWRPCTDQMMSEANKTKDSDEFNSVDLLSLKNKSGTSWWSRASEVVLPLQEVQVQSLGGELRSCMLCAGLPRWH